MWLLVTPCRWAYMPVRMLARLGLHRLVVLKALLKTMHAEVVAEATDGPETIERLSGMSHLSGILVEIRRAEGPAPEAAEVIDAGNPIGLHGQGLLLGVFAAENGKQLAEYKLKMPPVWDGMAAADYYVCEVCGYTCENEPPDECPVCKAKKKAFFKGIRIFL